MSKILNAILLANSEFFEGVGLPFYEVMVTNAILADILKIDVNKEHLVHKETEKSTLPLNFTELKLLIFILKCTGRERLIRTRLIRSST